VRKRYGIDPLSKRERAQKTNTHLAEEETIADIFDVRVVAFDACFYNVYRGARRSRFIFFFVFKKDPRYAPKDLQKRP
jgi:hypothetical protein